MLRTAALIGTLASAALGGVANFCVQEPFRQMQDFRDFEPAMSRCAAHYPAQTIVKTLANTCLTTTKTVILGTSTVHATNHLPCTTPHLEVRGGLEKRADSDELEDLEQRDLSALSLEELDLAIRDLEKRELEGRDTTRKELRRAKQRLAFEKERVERLKDLLENTTDPAIREKVQSKIQKVKSRIEELHSTIHPAPEPSHVPRGINEKRDAGPITAAVVKRDAMATKTAEWASYYTNLVECGYDCIQTACSCVASPRVVLQTPSPTCISTKTKETIVHVTQTIDVEPTQC